MPIELHPASQIPRRHFDGFDKLLHNAVTTVNVPLIYPGFEDRLRQFHILADGDDG
jgi:hypothetical protein